MRDAKLPIAYRDSCAHLLIPLNRCRYDTYYLPWKCTVSLDSLSLTCFPVPPPFQSTNLGPGPRATLTTLETFASTGREAQLRKVPVRRVPEASRQDGRATCGEGWCEEQLDDAEEYDKRVGGDMVLREESFPLCIWSSEVSYGFF
jgi:hypothetical protein